MYKILSHLYYAQNWIGTEQKYFSKKNIAEEL